MSAAYSDRNLVLPNPSSNRYQGAPLFEAPNTTRWYTTNYGCIRTDPTMIARLHSFPDAIIPRGLPEDPAAPMKVCSESAATQYITAWPQRVVDPAGMIETEKNHPQFAFRAGGPATPYQIDVESQLRRLDQPLGKCQTVIPDDAPLHRNTVAPPPVIGVPEGVQNASNPVAAMIRKVGAEACRIEADTVATAMSGRWLNNHTRQDTKRFLLPFEPPGVGSVRA